MMGKQRTRREEMGREENDFTDCAEEEMNGVEGGRGREWRGRERKEKE
jgi:hypothetical protein